MMTTGALAVASVLMGPSVSRATSPCRTTMLVPMTGALVELREEGVVVAPDREVLDAVPRFVCVRGEYSGSGVAAEDCWVPERHVTATLEPAP